ncbi:MAG: dipicolinate synthase subunit B [Erysipelotrichaceae bacterium]|nr:dipicolinate synthase subunit B [Erysipelotrichaceae bacterium]
MLAGKRILIGICGSFCNHRAVLEQFKKLAEHNHLTFVLTDNVYESSTRFFSRNEFLMKLGELSDDEIIHTIVEAEKIGPKDCYDIMLVAPCTATQCSKLVHGIYDNALTLAAKAMIRNKKNIVIGFASNDALGISGANLFRLCALKYIYVLPMAQDAPFQKAMSMVACWGEMLPTLQKALEDEQLQPIIRGYQE